MEMLTATLSHQAQMLTSPIEIRRTLIANGIGTLLQLLQVCIILLYQHISSFIEARNILAINENMWFVFVLFKLTHSLQLP